jgi:hypothetical protein
MNEACSYGEEQLISLLYEDGDEARVAELRAHLAACAGCRAELEALTSTREMLSAWPNAVNVPRMVYVNERSGFLARVRRWTDEIGAPGLRAVLRPIVAAAAVVLVLVAAAALLDLRVARDGSLQIGFGSGLQSGEDIADAAAGTPDGTGSGATGETAAGITKDELEEQLAQTVAYMEELFRSRSDEERRLLMAAIDERLQEQGIAMGEELQGAVDAAFGDIQQQQESDLGLIFSAIDELGVITGSELQRMNNILASLMERGPGFEEE